MRVLRQNTARTVLFGPIVDATDASAETGQTIAPSDRLFSKLGGDPAATTDGSNAVHKSGGHYAATFTATDLSTAGDLRLIVSKSGCAVFWEDFEVLTAQAYDARYVHPLIAQAIQYGTAQGGGAAAITLASAASSTNDRYNGRLIFIYDGTGAGEVNYVQDYVGSSRGAVMAANWVTEPDSTSKYIVLPWAAMSTLAEVSAAIGGQQLSGALHAYNVRPTRDQALLYLERFLSNLVQNNGTSDNVKDVDGTTNLATITYSPDNASPTSRTRTA